MTKVVCYYRHSTDNEQQEQNSIPDQKRQCFNFAKKNGWEIIEEVEDAGTSGAGDKKNFMELGQRALNGSISFDILLVRDNARITRKDVLSLNDDIYWLKDTGIKVSCVNGFPDPKTISELANDPAFLMVKWKDHRDVLEASERSVNGLLTQHENQTLSWIGPAPLGFDKETKQVESYKGPKKIQLLVANDELKIVTEMFEKFLAGSSVRGLVTTLQNARRYENKFANSTAVKHILRNPIYCGIWAFGKRNVGTYSQCNKNTKRKNYTGNVLENAAQIKEYDVEKAVSKKQFQDAQKILDSDPSRRRGAPATKNYRFTGLLKCGNCGAAMVAHKRNRKVGEKTVEQIDYKCAASTQSGIKCRDNEKPFAKGFPEEELIEYLGDFFAENVSFNNSFHLDLINKVCASILENAKDTDKEKTEELAQLEIEEIEVQKAFEKLHDLPDWLVEKQNKITRRRKELLDQDASDEFTLSEYVEMRAKEWIAKGGDEGGRYLNLIWNFSKKLAEQKEWNELEQKQIMSDFYNQWMEDNSQHSFVLNDEDQLIGITFTDPDQLLHVLKSMGLRDIVIHWKRGIKRGRAAWIIESIQLVFLCSDLVTSNHRTRTCVFNLCYH